MIRAFIAIDLPEGVIEGLEKLGLSQEISGHDVKWVNPQGIHLTLKFLGYMKEELVSPVSSTIAAIVRNQESLELRAEHIGAFPNKKNPRVIWAGIQGDTARLLILQKELERAMVPFGFEEEKRAFSPHLTLGRVRQGRKVTDLENKIKEIEKITFGSFRVNELILYQSILRPQGAVYNPLRRFPFGE